MVMLKSQTPFFKRSAALLGIVLIFQVGLGISNVWFSLPLTVAVFHNIVAACLMLCLISLTYSLRRKI